MLNAFRRLSKSTIGTGIIAIIGLLIIIGFGAGNISSLNIGSGGMGSTTLAKVGSLEVTDRDMSSAMQRQLAQVRQQNPEATYATIAGDFEPILESLINERALQAFAQKHGFVVSKRLIDAEISKLPGVKALNGEVTEQSYQTFLARERMTDSEVRDVVSGALLTRLLVTPAATDPRMPIGVATPFASMLLERRQGHVAAVPIAPFARGLNPTNAQIQQFYQSNRSRYMVPEQRVLKLARIGPEQVANVTATPKDIQAYYDAHKDQYEAKNIRVVDQAIVPDQKVAQAIADRARSGQSFADAAKPAGLAASDVSLGEQTREQFADIAGQKVAAAAWNAKVGSVIGPIQSPLGWHVVKIESEQTQKGKSLAEATPEITSQVTADKRKNALADLINNVQDLLDGGSNFDEAAKKAGLSVTTTPLVTATGVDRTNSSYKFPEELAPALKSGFQIEPTDEPAIETLEDDKGFVLVAPAQVVPAAPEPLAKIADKVKADWVQQQASAKALAFARKLAAAANGKASLEEAAKSAGDVPVEVEPAQAVRMQLSQMRDKIPAPLKTLFATAEGKTAVGALPGGNGFYVVKVDKVFPGNALNQPSLISQVQAQFVEPLAQEYAAELTNAMQSEVKVRRNEPVIQAAKKRMTGEGI